MSSESTLLRPAAAFIAGFAAVIAIHQSVAAILVASGIAPAALAPWSLEPIPPWGVPSLISKGFWGGLWGVLIALMLSGRSGASYWLGWAALSAIAPPLVAIFVVPVLKGGAPADFWARYPISVALNLAWGLGTALILRLHCQFSGARPR